MPFKLTITTIYKLHNYDHLYACLEAEGYGKSLIGEIYRGLQEGDTVDAALSNGSVMTVSLSGEVDAETVQ